MAGGVKLKKSSRKILDSSKQRVTAQRTLLLDILRRDDEHMDADELYRRAKQKYPRISLSTVYRNLQLFKKMGLIEERHFAEEHHHYEVKPTDEHQHLFCLDCGKVVEFACPLSNEFRRDIGMRYGFEVSGVEVRMTGLCSECLEEKDK